MITQERVKALFDYNELTGELSFVETKGRGKRKDKMVGCITKQGYLVVWAEKRSYQAHRLIWMHFYGKEPVNGIDHIDGNKLNNAIINLRDVSQQENTKNRRKSKNNTSGFVGVFWDKNKDKWRARVNVNKKAVYLGYFSCKGDAITARKKANIKYGFHENHGKDIS